MLKRLVLGFGLAAGVVLGLATDGMGQFVGCVKGFVCSTQNCPAQTIWLNEDGRPVGCAEGTAGACAGDCYHCDGASNGDWCKWTGNCNVGCQGANNPLVQCGTKWKVSCGGTWATLCTCPNAGGQNTGQQCKLSFCTGNC